MLSLYVVTAESTNFLEMEGMQSHKANVVVLAYHGQGHINPMVQFSKRLASKGIRITVATTLSNIKAMQAASDLITFASIYDDCTEGGVAGPGGFKGFLDRFETSGSRNLTKLILELGKTEYPVKCLVYDANISWAPKVAAQMGVMRAAFFTQSCAAIASYYPMHCDLSEKSLPVSTFSMPGLPKLGIPNLPSLGSDAGSYPPIIRHILAQFDNIEEADWVLFNSFDKLEEEVIKWMSTLWCVKTIGPAVPSVYLDQRVENDKDYGFNMYRPRTDTCMKWLNSRNKCSVVYVSFGSSASLSAEQMTEIAEALRQNNSCFLWVVKPTEENNLPRNFVEETSRKGLVVTWCPQLEVLAHPAVGCFVSHCGWNSTVEAISFGTPLVGMPQFLDQMINAYFVEKVWGVGMSPQGDEKGVVPRDEIGRCIQEIMLGLGEKGEKIRRNGVRLKELAKEAMDEGGSSDKYINDIVKQLEAA